MEIKKLKNRFGEYYRVTKILNVKGKKYRIAQRVNDPQKLNAQWDLTRSQMVSILENTEPQDWLFRMKGHFDGQTDGWEYDREDFRIANKDIIDWVIEQLKRFDGYKILYNEGDRDVFTNKLEKGAFEIYDMAIEDFEMKPSHEFIKLE
jgi:hypothetical protein